MADIFFFIVLVAVILYAASLAKKKAAARQRRGAPVQAGVYPTATMPDAQEAPGATQTGTVTVRKGGITVRVTSSSTASMGDGSPLTPYVEQVLQSVETNPAFTGVQTPAMDEIRKALEANGMGSMAAMVEQQLGQALHTSSNTVVTTSTGGADGVFEVRRSASDATEQAVPEQATGTLQESISSRGADVAFAAGQKQDDGVFGSTGTSPFDSSITAGNANPFGRTGDPFAPSPVFASIEDNRGAGTRHADDAADNALVKYLLDEFRRNTGVDLKAIGQEAALERLREAARRAEDELSRHDTTVQLMLVTRDVSGPKSVQLQVTRKTLEMLG